MCVFMYVCMCCVVCELLRAVLPAYQHSFCVHMRNVWYVLLYSLHKPVSQMHIAAANGYGDVMKYLVKRNADVNVQDDSGSTPLHVAAKFGQVSVFCNGDHGVFK